MADQSNPRIEITYQDVQRAGKDILDYADEPSPTLDELDNFTTRIAVRLCFAARAMKPTHEHPASVIVRTFCDEVGLDYEAVDRAVTQIAGEHRVNALMAQMKEEA